MSGNYTPINNGVRVPGVVNPGDYHGKLINQMPWFNGELNSTNVTPDQGHGFPVNWLDGGGQAALHRNQSAFDRNSNQYYYFIHLHEYFAYLLGCSIYGNQVDRYNGSTNMYHVHKYMNINNDMMQYTNLQFVLSAASLGFSESDQAYIGRMLQLLFSFKCEKPISLPEWASPASQSMCSGDECPVFPGHSQCPAEVLPKPVPVAAPNSSRIRVYSCEGDLDDIDKPGDGCLATDDKSSDED